MLNVFITNLNKYNNSELVGEWVDLPIAQNKLEKILKKIIGDDEYFISDYESDFYKVNEYEGIEHLNTIAEDLTKFEEIEQKIIKELIKNGMYTFEEAVKKISDSNYIIYNNCQDMTDVAYKMIESNDYLTNMPDFVKQYFDYEAFGRDLDIEGTFFYIDENTIVEILH